MQGKTVALVGRMVANSNALSSLKTGLEAKGAKVNALLGDSKGVLTVTDEQLRTAIAGADIAVVGMGHPENVAGEELRAAAMCRDLGVSYFFYADNPVFGGGKLARPWCAEALSGAVGVFVPKQTDADDAKAFMPRLRAVASGNPTHEDMGRVGLSCEEARTKYRVGSQEMVMIVSFTKDPKLNKEIAAAAIGAASLANHWAWRVFLCLHPGDPSCVGEYDEVMASASEGVKVVAVISPKAAKAQNEKTANSDVLPLPVTPGTFDSDMLLVEATEPLVDAADVIIDPTGSAMVARSAMHRPDHYIRVITVFTPYGLKRAVLERPEDAEFAKEGTAPTVMVVNPEEGQRMLASKLQDMMTWEGFGPFQDRQLQLYATPPPKGTAVGKMVSALEHYLEDRVTMKALEDPGDGPAEVGDTEVEAPIVAEAEQDLPADSGGCCGCGSDDHG